jgi:putative membrane protein insertion efficiency factor
MPNPQHPAEQTTPDLKPGEGHAASPPVQSLCGYRETSPGHWIRHIIAAPATMLVLAVRGYQLAISPLLGKHCRFVPSCSQYFIEAVRKRGAIRGAAQGLQRICRCHPWHPGGYDPP